MRISEAEIDIMQIIWKKGRITSFDVIEEVKQNKQWSENTIRTLLARLVKKGAIKIVEKQGKTYIYEPILEEKEFKQEENNHFLNKIYQGSISSMLLNFVKEEKLSKTDLEELIRKIEEEK